MGRSCILQFACNALRNLLAKELAGCGACPCAGLPCWIINAHCSAGRMVNSINKV